MCNTAALADRIDALLPQTQCGRCAHPGCRPYAEAIAAGTVPINRCAPGGVSTIAMLADGRLRAEPLITNCVPLSQGCAHIREFENRGATNVKTLLEIDPAA